MTPVHRALADTEKEERWYEFEQHELLVRSFWVRARTLEAARALVRAHPSGSGIGAPDYASNGPDWIAIKGRGRLAPDQDRAQDRSDELESQGGW